MFNLYFKINSTKKEKDQFILKLFSFIFKGKKAAGFNILFVG